MEFLKLKEVAAILKVSTPTLYAWRDTGKIKFIKICGRNRITREELNRFIKAQEQQTAEANQLMETRKAWRSEIRSREDFREQESLMRKGFRMLVKTDAQKRLFTNSWLQDSPELFDLFVAAGKLAAEDSMHPQAQTSKPTEAEINMQRFPNL
jgi:excisionase family DNA binding protein